MYLTDVEYKNITGEDAPAEFDEYLLLAQGYFDLLTFSYFEQLGGLDGVPSLIVGKIKSLLAYSVMNIEQQGGIAGMIAPKDANSVTIGKFSMGGMRGAAASAMHPVTSTLLPVILAYVRAQGGV